LQSFLVLLGYLPRYNYTTYHTVSSLSVDRNLRTLFI
jgi:hypothetical protein